jgi:hypothetical protein
MRMFRAFYIPVKPWCREASKKNLMHACHRCSVVVANLTFLLNHTMFARYLYVVTKNVSK